MLWLLGGTGKRGLVLVGSGQGVEREIGQGGQMERESDRETEPSWDKDKLGAAEGLESSFQAVPLWLLSTFPS